MEFIKNENVHHHNCPENSGGLCSDSANLDLKF